MKPNKIPKETEKTGMTRPVCWKLFLIIISTMLNPTESVLCTSFPINF